MDVELETRLYRIECQLDELRVLVDRMLPYFEAYARIEQRQMQQQRYLAARAGGALINRREIQRKTGVTAERVKAWTMEPTFPPPVKLGSGRRPHLYGKEAVDAWLEEHYKRPKVRAALLRKQVQAELEAEAKGAE